MLGRKKPQRPVTLGSCCGSAVARSPGANPVSQRHTSASLTLDSLWTPCCSLSRGIRPSPEGLHRGSWS